MKTRRPLMVSRVSGFMIATVNSPWQLAPANH